MTDSPYMTIKQLAERWHLSGSDDANGMYIRRKIKSGDLAAVKLSERKTMVTLESVLAFEAKKSMEAEQRRARLERARRNAEADAERVRKNKEREASKRRAIEERKARRKEEERRVKGIVQEGSAEIKKEAVME